METIYKLEQVLEERLEGIFPLQEQGPATVQLLVGRPAAVIFIEQSIAAGLAIAAPVFIP